MIKVFVFRFWMLFIPGFLTLACSPYTAAPGATRQSQAASALDTNQKASRWIRCAAEGGICSFSGTRKVRYGLNNLYVIKTVTGPVSCDNIVFGDPSPGTDKFCDYSSNVSTTAPTPTPAPVGGSLLTDHIFAANSFWYTPIPVDAAPDARSAAMVQDIQRQITTYYGTVTITTDSFSSPVYIADANTPTKAVGFNDCQNIGYFDAGLQQQWSAVPIPSLASPSLGTDMEMTIYQPSTDTIYEFWQAIDQNGKWTACWGGKMSNVSQSQGYWPGYYGTTAAGLPFLGGQVTAEELTRGEIRHALGISLVDIALWNSVSWPAQRSDGNGRGLISEGQRMRLDPTINVDALPLSRAAKIIAKAAQIYGFMVWDTAGTVALRAQNSLTYTSQGLPNPYPALYEQREIYRVLDGFPWGSMQILPMNYGKP